MPPKRRTKGEGTYETIGNSFRYIKTLNGQRLKGPAAPTRPQAQEAWRQKFINSQERASAAANEPLRSLVATILAPDSDHPFLAAWRVRWETSTLDRFLGHLRAIENALPVIPHRTLATLKDTDLLTLRANLGTSPHTRKNRIEALSILAKSAGVTLPPIKREQITEREFTIVMPGEEKRLMELATNDRDLLTFALLYYCGLRVCELTGLKKRDYKNGELHITRSAVMSKGSVIVKPRTKTRRPRTVPVPRKWLREMIEDAPNGFLIHQPGQPDMPVSDRTIHHLVTRRTKGTEFEGLCPLAIRHSAATAYALSGVPLEAAAALMGHSAAMLSKIYARYRPDVRADLARRAFGGD